MGNPKLDSDSWALKEITGEIAKSSRTNELSAPEPPLRGYRGVLVEALDGALEMIGRSGREVLYGIMESRYNLKRVDFVDKTGVYVSAMRDILGSPCGVIEQYVLGKVRETSGIEAHTVEEAVFLLKKKYGDS